ncbi:MAG TPA: efflux RND transporter permease subunit, partial [Chroococcales cyanobacterium]
MNLSEIFIRRPVMTTLLSVAILLFGCLGYSLLPVSNLPNVEFPTIQVSAGLPGAGPETMAAAIATPLERQFATIPGLESMTSSSSQDSTQITLQFALDRAIDAAAQDVQTAIAAALRRLPPGMPTPPTFRKVNPAEQPILFLDLNSKVLPLSSVDEFAQTVVAQRVSTISGVAQVQVHGSQKYAVRAQLDPAELASRGIGVEEVAQAIQQGNSNQPTGTLYGKNKTYAVESNGQLTDAAAYRRLIVAYRNGAPIRLQELGNIIDGVENDKAASWYNGSRGVVLAIQRQPGTNTIEVVDAIQKVLPALRAQLPASVKLDLVYNRANSIRASVQDVQFTLLLTMGLVILVIFLFLRNLPATLIPSLALPTSILGTFAVMSRLGFNLDNLSLMALTLSTGFVVDDAIVMLENIVRHVESGDSPLEAAFKGSREIGFTILAMTVSLVAVLIPILFMGGILGRLLNEFALTIGAAILVSCFVSLSLTPMLASRFLRPFEKKPRSFGFFYRALEGIFEGALGSYERALGFVLKHHKAALLFTWGLVLVSAVLFVLVPKGLIPAEDIDQISGSTEAIQGISFPDMIKHQRAIARILEKDPNIAGVVSNVGSGGRNSGGNSGSFVIRLKPRSQRRLDSEAIIKGLRPKFAKVPGIKVFLQTPPSIRIGGQSSKSLYQLTLKGTVLSELYRATPVLEEKMRDRPELLDVTSDLQASNPVLKVEIDRDRASALG